MTHHIKTEATRFTEPSEREVSATRVFDAPRETVWKAHTECEHVRQWQLGPGGWAMTVCEMDVRAGGTWRYAWEGPGGEELEMNGEYREVVPMERIVNTEAWGGDWPEALDTMTLAEENGKTTLTVTVLYESKAARDRALGTGMKEGWSESYDRLEKHLKGATHG